jgi:pyruvate,water dikinase
MTQTEPTYVIKLEDVEKDNQDVGSKAISLSELLKSNFSVPPGFVLTRQAFEKFAKANKLESRIANLMKDLNPGDFRSLREVSEKIRGIITNSNIPDYLEREIRDAYEELSVGKEAKELGGVALDLIRAGRGEAWLAVRSSLIGEFMEQGKSVLNVRGGKKLSDAVKQCWASLFTPRAMLHRREKRIEGFPSMGLVIQKMVDSEKSGNIFTYQPETQDRSKIVVEGVPGLGEVMLELVTPDEYTLDKETGEVLDRKIRRKLWMLKRDPLSGETVRESVSRRDMELDVLNEKELIKLWELALKVERQDGARAIEWCMERGRIFLLHSHPIKEFPMPAEEHALEGKPLTEGVGIYPGFAKGNAKIVFGQPDISKIEPGDILVAMMTSDVMIPAFKKISGIVTDSGGRTCHAARLARELGIPCIVGAETATTLLKDDQVIGIDGINGRVYFKEPEPLEPRMPGMHEPEAYGEYLRPDPSTETKDFTATQVKVSLTLPDMAEKARESDGVGLLRAEHLLSESGRHPIYLAKNNPDEFSRILYDSLERIARILHPKPVFYRSLDVRTDDFTELEDSEDGEEEAKEANPILGWHGIRRSLDEPEMFRMEIGVLRRLHQNGMNNIMLVLPFISSVEELRRAKSFLDFPIKTGIMIETPAAALNIENFCREGIDFVSIGSDDLTQLVLGIDRDNPSVSRLYTDLNPAMINLIKHVVRVCKQHGVKVSVCGDVGSDPRSVETLVELGVDSVTSDLDALEQIKETVARTERKLLLDNVRKKQNI